MMRKLQLLLLFLFTSFLFGCRTPIVRTDNIYVGSVDILDDINSSDKKLRLYLFSQEEYASIKPLIDYENILYQYSVVYQNEPQEIIENGRTVSGFSHLIEVEFLSNRDIFLTEVVLCFDNQFYQFDIGSYKITNLDHLTGVRQNDFLYEVDFVLPPEVAHHSVIKNLNIDVRVTNKNNHLIVGKGIQPVIESEGFFTLFLENRMDTSLVEPGQSAVTNLMYLSAQEERYFEFKSYYIYELIYEVRVESQNGGMRNQIARELLLVSLEIGTPQSCYKLNKKLINCDYLQQGLLI